MNYINPFATNGPETRRQCISIELENIREMVGQLGAHLDMIHYKVHGPQPEPVGKDEPATQGINRVLEQIKGQIHALNERAYSLSESL